MLQQDSGRNLAHGEDPRLEQVFWQDLWSHGEIMLEQSVPDGLQLVERTHAGAVLQLMGRTRVGEVHEGRGGILLEQRKRVRRVEWQTSSVMN